MNVVQKIALAICQTIMLTSLSLFVIGLIFRVTIGNHQLIKTTLSESGIYVVATKEFKEQLRSANFTNTESNNPIIDNAIERAIRTEAIQSFAESGISQTYAWLEGDIKTPQFSLDIAQFKTDLANAIADGLTERAATLPACSSRIKPTTNDIFTINCIPPGVDINVEISKIKQQILATDTNQLGQNTPINAESIVIGKNQQPYYQNLAQLPKFYQLLKNSVFILTGIFLLMAMAVIILKKPRYKALKVLALPFMIYGILYVFAGYIAPVRLNMLVDANVKSINPPDFIAPLKFIATSMIKQGSGALTKIGIIFFVIGLACLIIYILLKRKSASEPDSPANPKTNPQPNL